MTLGTAAGMAVLRRAASVVSTGPLYRSPWCMPARGSTSTTWRREEEHGRGGAWSQPGAQVPSSRHLVASGTRRAHNDEEEATRQWVDPEVWERLKQQRWQEVHNPRVDPATTPPLATAVSIGGCAGVSIGVLTAMDALLGGTGFDSALLMASFGSTAALLFVLPISPFSQPRSVVGGHVLSAAAGICTSKLVAAPLMYPPLAVPLSVAAATFAMLKTRTFHPPAAGTAMAMAGATHGYIADVGMAAILPVSVGATLLVGTAIVLNRTVFENRVYPTRWWL